MSGDCRHAWILLQDALAELRTPVVDAAATRQTLETELRRIEQEQQRHADAIASAGDVPALVKALREREQRC